MPSHVVPQPRYDAETFLTANIFRDRFGALDDDRWLELLVRSVQAQTIDGIEFPRFPDEELQNRIHGHAAEHSMREAFNFYRFVKSRPSVAPLMGAGTRFLDFASGWGRISRPFMKHFDLVDMYGFEPNPMFCAIARSLNPYLSFLGGEYEPNRRIPTDNFDLVVGWSIFSHLSRNSARSWLGEMARVMRVGGSCVFTTWGERFLLRLAREQEQLGRGEDIHWYSRTCIDAAGALPDRLAEYRAGEFVWFTSGGSTLYGEAFVGQGALQGIIREDALPFELVEFDAGSLAQDVFVLRRIAD